MAKVSDLTQLLAQLSDSNPRARKKAVNGIGQMGDPSAVPALDAALRVESDKKVAERIVHAIASFGGPEAARALAFGLTDLDLGLFGRTSLAASLGSYPDDPCALDALVDALRDESGTVRQMAALALAHFSNKKAAEAVEAAFRSGAIKPPGVSAGITPVAVARTIELFIGDDAVRDALALRVRPSDTVMAALRMGFPQAQGGLVALQDRLIVAVRQQERLRVPKTPNRLFEATYKDVEEFGRVLTGFRIRAGGDVFEVGIDDDFDLVNKTNKWLWEQWQPHVVRIADMIKAAKSA